MEDLLKEFDTKFIEGSPRGFDSYPYHVDGMALREIRAFIEMEGIALITQAKKEERERVENLLDSIEPPNDINWGFGGIDCSDLTTGWNKAVKYIINLLKDVK